MMLRAIELIMAWYQGHITHTELLEELRLALKRAETQGRNIH